MSRDAGGHMFRESLRVRLGCLTLIGWPGLQCGAAASTTVPPVYTSSMWMPLALFSTGCIGRYRDQMGRSGG